MTNTQKLDFKAILISCLWMRNIWNTRWREAASSM